MSDEKESAKTLSPKERVIDYVKWHEAAYMAPAPPEEVREQLSRRHGLDAGEIDDLMRGMQLDNAIYFVEQGECFGWALVELSAPPGGGKESGMAYFTPLPGWYMSGYVFTTTRISGSRINGEIRTAASGEFMGSVGFEIDNVMEIHHPKDYEFDTGEPYVPGGQDE